MGWQKNKDGPFTKIYGLLTRTLKIPIKQCTRKEKKRKKNTRIKRKWRGEKRGETRATACSVGFETKREDRGETAKKKHARKMTGFYEVRLEIGDERRARDATFRVLARPKNARYDTPTRQAL